MLTRATDESVGGHDDTVSIFVERDLLRTVFFTMLLGGFATLVGYFALCISRGEGRGIFELTASLAALLACGAAASRARMWLRFLLVLGSLSVFALLVDQIVYYRWHRQVDGLVTTLQQSIESGLPLFPNRVDLQPTSFLIDPDREVLLTFEPPILAWTYRLDSASSLGHTLIAGGYGILSRATRDLSLDNVGRTLVQPHEAYSISVRSEEGTLACQKDAKGPWTLSIDTQRGDRPL